LEILKSPGISLVGSRDLNPINEEFAREAGKQAALQSYTLVSGNARGADKTAQNACLAADEFDNVRCIDSNNLTTGQGLVVLKACELAQSTQSLDALAEELEAYSQKIETSFLVDKLDYLVKGGRCSSAAALGANLLNLKPCIEVKDGKMSVVKKYRGNYAKCLSNYVKDRLADREDIERGTLFITQAVLAEDCHQAVLDAVQEYGHFEKVYETFTGCTVSCHCGPGTLGIIFVRNA
jgi:DegV family protein with EDD domain